MVPFEFGAKLARSMSRVEPLDGFSQPAVHASTTKARKSPLDSPATCGSVAQYILGFPQVGLGTCEGFLIDVDFPLDGPRGLMQCAGLGAQVVVDRDRRRLPESSDLFRHHFVNRAGLAVKPCAPTLYSALALFHVTR